MTFSDWTPCKKNKQGVSRVEPRAYLWLPKVRKLSRSLIRGWWAITHGIHSSRIVEKRPGGVRRVWYLRAFPSATLIVYSSILMRSNSSLAPYIRISAIDSFLFLIFAHGRAFHLWPGACYGNNICESLVWLFLLPRANGLKELLDSGDIKRVWLKLLWNTKIRLMGR